MSAILNPAALPLPSRPRSASLPGALVRAALPLVLLIVYLHLPVYAYTLDKSLLPKYFYMLFIALLAPTLLLRLPRFIAYLCSPFALWMAALLLLDAAHLMFGAGEGARNASLVAFRMQAGAMVILLGFVFSLQRPGCCQNMFVLLAVLLPCAVIADFLYPGLLYPLDTPGAVLGRAAGTFINPTIAGEALLLCFLLACPALPRQARTPLFLLVGIGVLLTFTRAAMLAWLMLWLYLTARRRLSGLGTGLALAALVLPLLMGGLESYLGSRKDFGAALENIHARLSFFSTKSRLDDDSAREREQVLRAGLELFLENPVAGAGAGATDSGQTRTWPHPVSTHNQLVSLAAEYGIAGIAIWLWLLALLLRGRHFEDRAFKNAVILLFVLMSFFTHNMMDFPYWLLSFALLSERNARQRSQGRQAPPARPLRAPLPAAAG